MLVRARGALALLAAALLAACGTDGGNGGGREAIPVAVAPADAPLVIYLGDSLTAGPGLAEEQTYPALVAARLAARGLPIRTINAGVSGDTTAGGLRRLDWVLGQEPDVVVVGLGANDGLRGQPVAAAEANLRAVLTRVREAGAEPILLGMRLPPNLGRAYTEAFAAIYPRLAGELDVDLVPFLLEGVAGRRSLNLEDGIHPNAAGHAILAETVEPFVARAVRRRAR